LTDRAETVTSSKQTVVTEATVKKYITFEAIVTTDDTITLGDLATFLGGVILKKADGADVAFTADGTELTITEAALSDVAVVGFAYGT
jgi:hypothetical protein